MKISRPSLAVYLMANEAAPELAEAAVRGGATVIELGIPYSDPLADGTTIQRAAQAALDAGITPQRSLELLAEIHARVDVPLVPMTYGAIVEGYGIEAFCRDASAAGAEALIVADIPPEESGALRTAAAAEGVDLIGIERGRLLNKYMLASGDGGARQFHMAIGRRADRDELDVRSSQKRIE